MDYLWVFCSILLLFGLTIKMLVDVRRLNKQLTERNAQKVFHMSMQLPDRLKMDLS